jgi:hypothetical protein
MMICTVAVFSSPDFAFLKEKWDVIVGTFAFSTLYVLVMSLVVLAISALSSRKAYALAGVFALMVGSEAISAVTGEIQRDHDWHMLGLWNNFHRVGDWMLSSHNSTWDWNPWFSAAVLGGVSALSIVLIAWRLRRMEVVA